MKTTFLVVGLMALLAACASTQPNEMLERAHSVYDDTSAMPGIESSAPSQLDSAEIELSRADELHRSGADTALVEHHALLSIKYSELAEERLALQNTKEEIRNASGKRQELLLTAREQKAIAAEQRAEAALTAAELARNETRQAERQLRSAQEEASILADKLQELEAQDSERGIVLTLEDVIFDVDSAVLQRGGKRVIERVAEFLTKFESRQVLVEGSTDNTGEAEYNLRLSLKRADSVKNALVDAGIAADRISTVGLGENYPVATNDSAAGRQQNRRVEMIVSNADDTLVEKR